jgi:hypothetical protein
MLARRIALAKSGPSDFKISRRPIAGRNSRGTPMRKSRWFPCRCKCWGLGIGAGRGFHSVWVISRCNVCFSLRFPAFAINFAHFSTFASRAAVTSFLNCLRHRPVVSIRRSRFHALRISDQFQGRVCSKLITAGRIRTRRRQRLQTRAIKRQYGEPNGGFERYPGQGRRPLPAFSSDEQRLGRAKAVYERHDEHEEFVALSVAPDNFCLSCNLRLCV